MTPKEDSSVVAGVYFGKSCRHSNDTRKKSSTTFFPPRTTKHSENATSKNASIPAGRICFYSADRWDRTTETSSLSLSRWELRPKGVKWCRLRSEPKPAAVVSDSRGTALFPNLGCLGTLGSWPVCLGKHLEGPCRERQENAWWYQGDCLNKWILYLC